MNVLLNGLSQIGNVLLIGIAAVLLAPQHSATAAESSTNRAIDHPHDKEAISYSTIDLQRSDYSEPMVNTSQIDHPQGDEEAISYSAIDLQRSNTSEPMVWKTSQTELFLTFSEDVVSEDAMFTGDVKEISLAQLENATLKPSEIQLGNSVMSLDENSIMNGEQEFADLREISPEITAQSPESLDDESGAEEDEDPWRVEIQPYLFIPFNIDGNILIGDDAEINDRFDIDSNDDGRFPVQIDFERDLSDFLELDFTNLLWLAGRVEVWNDDVNLGLIVQSSYANIGLEQEGDLFDINLRTELFTLDVALGYHLGTVPLRSIDESEDADDVFPSLAFEAFGGGRYGSITQEVNFNPGPDFEFGPDWFEPFVGGRVALNLSDRIALGVRADSSLGIGDGSDQNWNILIGLDWQLSRNFSLRPAYRIYQLTVREEGRFGDREVSLRAEGLWLGAVLQF